MANILVPFDFSANAIAALDQALLIADGKGFSVEVLHILNFKAAHEYPKDWRIDPHHVDLGIIEEKLNAVVKERISNCCETGAPEVTSLVRESVMINGGIINHMLLNKADLIVMGTHGATNAIERFWGSNTSTMINHSLFPILAVPPHWHPVKLRELVAAVTLKEATECIPNILHWAGWMQTSTELVTLTSVPAADQEHLDDVLKNYPDVKAHLVPKVNDLPMWRNLVQFTADRKEALLMMFVHERTVFEKLFNYSITSRVADGIHIPLLAVPAKHKTH
ncbi:universal stress protein [Flavihumibacter stibioxidans]|uniref:UspA domain-containing protein n=1 Tax=Flavihumibacter stibioxidans TaxID=1834163 RepID=A0ABR7MA63_9BACT|nr:universal stress protein [Flavihumibacter stibioxidans]MBC6491929.1 hypothetical protein [Flavihumibacter stibioxidans]